MKKVTFCKLKTSLSRNFVYNLQTFRGFCQVNFYDSVANTLLNIFLPTSKHRQEKRANGNKKEFTDSTRFQVSFVHF